MLGWGLGTKTSALEVSPWERAGGRVEQRLLGRSSNQSVKFEGAETAWETRKQNIARRGSNTLRAGMWKATSEQTWEKSWDCTSVVEGREGVGPHRILPMTQRDYWPASYQKAVLQSASPPLPPLTHAMDLGLPATSESWPQQLPEAYHHRGCCCPGLLALWRDYTPWSSTKHLQSQGKGLQPRKARISLAGP